MASQQEQRRRENTTEERKMQVESDIVNKRSTQFEELASKVSDTAATASVDADRKRGSTTTVVMGVSQTPGKGGMDNSRSQMGVGQTVDRSVMAQTGAGDGLGLTKEGGTHSKVGSGMSHTGTGYREGGGVAFGSGVSYTREKGGVGRTREPVLMAHTGVGGGMRHNKEGAGMGYVRARDGGMAGYNKEGDGVGHRGGGVTHSGDEGIDHTTSAGDGMGHTRASMTHSGGGGGQQQQTRGSRIGGGKLMPQSSDYESITNKVGGLEFGGGINEERGSSDKEMEYDEMAKLAPEGQKGQHGVTSMGKFEMNEAKERAGEGRGRQEYGKKETPLEEISSYRQTAQQNSIESVQAAQQRYEKAKEQAANAAWEAKEAAKQGLGAAGAKTSELASTAQQKTRSGVGATTQYISEKSRPVVQTAAEKAQQAKEAISIAGQKSVGYTGEKAVQAKDTTVESTKNVAGYVGEKAVQAKDVAVRTGKTAAEYAGKLAEDVKDQAVVTGWGAAHYTSEVAVGATKKAGGVAVMAKDAMASATFKAAELAEVPVVIAKDATVDTGEKLADYTARKKIEAEKYKEQKHSHYDSEESWPLPGKGVTGMIQQGVESVEEKGRGMLGSSPSGGATHEFQGTRRCSMENGVGKKGDMVSDKEEGLLEAVGETIAEIAQHTTNLVAGTEPPPAVREKAEVQHEKEF